MSIPSPSRSNFTSPAAAQSSLSHWSTERFSIRAHSIGQHSTSGRSAITIPPEWMPRWRGKSCTCSASSSTSSGTGGASSLSRKSSNAPSLRAPPVDPAGDRVGVAGRQARDLRHLAQRRARPVGDDVRHLRGAVPPVPLVDVLDHLLPALVLDVEVDVGRAVALGGEEPLEEQAERDRVGLGDPERVADRAVRRAPPALAVDVVRPAELDDVVQQQEVAGEAELLDHPELVVDLAHRLRVVRRGSTGSTPPRRAAVSSRSQLMSVWPSGTG